MNFQHEKEPLDLLMEECKMNKKHIRRLENVVASMRQRNQEMEMKLNAQQMQNAFAELKQQRDYYFKKCKIYESKFAEQQKLVDAAQEEIERLHGLVSHRNDVNVASILSQMEMFSPDMEAEDLQIEMEPEAYANETEAEDCDDRKDIGELYRLMDTEINPRDEESATGTARESHPSKRFKSTLKKEYACPAVGCGKKFPIKSYFLRHIVTHTGEKPFACTFPGCGKSFTQSGSLNKHTMIHTGEKPFKCDIDGCGRGFAYRRSLKMHAGTHDLELSGHDEK